MSIELGWDVDDQRQHREEMQRKRQEWRDKNTPEILALINKGYDVEMLTEYQYRINGVVDVFPTSKKYHNIKLNRRGRINGDLERFLVKYLKVFPKEK